jgi:hypothetical protein
LILLDALEETTTEWSEHMEMLLVGPISLVGGSSCIGDIVRKQEA